MFLSCPHCGGVLIQDFDGYDNYLTCLMCAREFDLNMCPRRMTKETFDWFMQFGKKLTKKKENVNMRVR